MAERGVELDAHSLAASLRPHGGVPLHTQLAAAIRQLIRTGGIAPGSSLPGELELATALAMSRHTIRHALSELAVEGLLSREPGRGTRVLAGRSAPVTERSLGSFYAFAWEVSARGVEQRSYVLKRETLPAAEALARELALRPGARVQRIERLRTAGGEPLVLETAYLPLELAERLGADDLERGSVYDAIERDHGLRVTGAHETIRPIVVTRALARLLEVRPGSAAFQVVRTTWSDRGPIERQESVVRGDRYLYSVDLPRGPAPDELRRVE